MSVGIQLKNPISNYIGLIKEKRSPYYDVIKYIYKELQDYSGKTEIYTLNPRFIKEKLEREGLKHEKLTVANICRTIQAWFYAAGLEKGEEFYITTTSSGRKNYHVILNPLTLYALRNLLI